MHQQASRKQWVSLSSRMSNVQRQVHHYIVLLFDLASQMVGNGISAGHLNYWCWPTSLLRSVSCW